MTKSELIDSISADQHNLPNRDIELAIKSIIEHMSQALATGNHRIEIRGFGSFSLHFRPPRIGRNPKTGDAVTLAAKQVPHFKPGKDLRDRVNKGFTPPPDFRNIKSKNGKTQTEINLSDKHTEEVSNANLYKTSRSRSRTRQHGS